MSDNLVDDKISTFQDVWPGGDETQYFRYGGDGYKSGVRHYLESSADVAYAVVQPGSEKDIGDILRFIGKAKESGIDIPFAVKGGGHSTNPGFSSTKGLQLAMTRFNKITYNPEDKSLSVGAGCLWDEVYREVERLSEKAGDRRNVVGGSAIDGVGVAGYLLGGGYSLKTNQFGLAIDNILAVDVVLPDGQFLANVGPNKNPDLFWAIRGGGNNFGIITKFVLKTHEQGKVWGTVVPFDESAVPKVKQLLLDYIAVRDKYPRAALVAAFRYFNLPTGLKFQLTVQFFYDEPKLPREPIFRQFTSKEYGRAGAEIELDTMTYAQLDQKFSRYNVDHDYPEMAGVGENPRGRWANIMVSTYSKELIDEIEAQAKRLSAFMLDHTGKKVVTDLWPFVTYMFDKSLPAGWPHLPGKPNGPAMIYAQWEDKQYDSFWVSEIEKSAKEIKRVAVATKCATEDAPVYLNTTMAEMTKVEAIYRENFGELVQKKRKYDPSEIMGLAGGFKIPALIPSRDS